MTTHTQTPEDQMELTVVTPKMPTEAIPLAPTGDPITDMINRVASNPDASIETLERMIALRDKEQNAQAEREFNIAFAAAQKDMPAIPKRGKGYTNDYALWEDVNKSIIKILSKNEMSISYTSDFSDAAAVLVTATLRHGGGHSISGQFYSPIESPVNKNGKESMNKAQQRGSAMSYGKRYATINLLSLTTHGEDDDAFASGDTGIVAEWREKISGCEQTKDAHMKLRGEIQKDLDMTGPERAKIMKIFSDACLALPKSELEQ